jgi:hypothetical protein
MAVLTSVERRSKLNSLLSPTTRPRRPLLTHLSADNSWLLSLPIPDSAPTATSQNAEQRHQKLYFHLLLDAWLTPSNTPFPSATWFQVIHHVETPACQSIAEVNDLIADIEAAACGAESRSKAGIDAVVVGHYGPDHMNYDTLKQVDASVPVFAADIAFPTLQSWKHFDTVVQIPQFETDSADLDWRAASSTEAPHLPSWLTVWRIPGPRQEPALHWAICIVFTTSGSGQVPAECVIHSPHGPRVDDMAVLKRLNPEVKTLALLHTTKESTFYWWGKANLGAKHGVEVAEAVEAKYCKFTPFFILFGV